MKMEKLIAKNKIAKLHFSSILFVIFNTDFRTAVWSRILILYAKILFEQQLHNPILYYTTKKSGIQMPKICDIGSGLYIYL